MTLLPPIDARVRWLAAAAVLAALLLQFVPAIDTGVSRLFYDGRGFPAETDAAVKLLRRLAQVPGYVLAAAMAASLASRLLRRRWLFGLDRKAIVYLLAVALAGPVVLVNGVLKEHWGRARPYQTVEFGGTRAHTPPFVPTDQCTTNCSFVSGEVSYGFAFVALGFLLAGRARRRAFAAAVGFGLVLALIRVSQGGHYLSDAAFAALFTVTIAWLFHHWLVREDAIGRLLRLGRAT